MLALRRVPFMDFTGLLMCRTYRLRWLNFRNTRSIFRSMLWNAAGSTDGAGAVWVPVDEVCACVEPRPEGCPAPVAMLGPGSIADVGTTVPAVAGATWLEVVVVLVVAVVGKVGPPCGKALHAPEARSWQYLRAILLNPDSTSRMCWYLMARRWNSRTWSGVMFAAVKTNANNLH
ncbi:hypothetical protein NDU88_007004 [Pleurodeles waltl]|uniref:Uncharacterized protein n=1 Tax=Pleurodeles waltl TaxID=8319 RepID=A0AAV7RTN1_PLEWA|nr:hypothetical protein NDU88_007004 [Pleurodeles waltl]